MLNAITADKSITGETHESIPASKAFNNNDGIKAGESKKWHTAEKEPRDKGKNMDTSREKIERVAETMDSYVKSIRRNLNISVHDDTGNIIVKVTGEDGKIIREIPPEELIDLATKMKEMIGALVNKKA